MSVSWAGSGSLVFSSVFSAVVFAEEVNVGDEESGDTTTVDVQALLEAFFEHYYYYYHHHHHPLDHYKNDNVHVSEI